QASARSFTEKHLNYSFRTHVIDTDRAQLWNRWIKEKGFKKVALLAENTDYGLGLVEDTKKLLAPMGVPAELKTIVFDRAVVDLPPQLRKTKAWNPALVTNVGVGTPASLITKEAQDVGLLPATPMLVSYDMPSRPEFWKNVGDKGNYVAFMV